MHNNRTPDLSAKETWSGGYYETAIMLGRCRDASADERLRSAILAIWAASSLRNPATDHKSDFAAMGQIDLDTAPLDKIGRLYGYMLHEKFGAIPFTTIVVRETHRTEASTSSRVISAPVFTSQSLMLLSREPEGRRAL
jgi:hypothetical protein